VQEADFTDSLERIVLGAERQVMLSESDRRRTAYHEAGHAIVGMLTAGADPVRLLGLWAPESLHTSRPAGTRGAFTRLVGTTPRRFATGA